MFYNYKILNVSNEEILYLYVNSLFEFSNEIDHKDKPRSIFKQINDYIKNMKISFNGKKVMLVVNGIIFGSIMLVTNDFSNIDNSTSNYITYNENIDIDKKDNVDIIDINNDIRDFLKDEISTDNDSYVISNFVKMKDNKGKTTYVDLDKYMISEISKVIAPTYEDEAIKAVAIITRTNVFKELYENNCLIEDGFRSADTLKKIWKNNFNSYMNKIKRAIEDTNYQYLSSSNYYFNFNIRDKYKVPFSSYDANNLAKNGYNYLDILNHYYSDASLETV